MNSNTLLFVLLIQRCSLIQISSQNNLVSVSVIYRHGDRSPFEPFPTDPYRYPQYWPMGYGQLTNIGKMQQYQLGLYFRNMYRGFLSSNYNVTEVRVLSTDTDRTLMSAQSNLAGLYPPGPDQTWNANLEWQPIPVHTAPAKEDYLLAMKKPCKRYQQLVYSLMRSSEFVEINRNNRELYEYLTKNTGQQVKDLAGLNRVYNVLYVESLYNLTLPKWSKSVYSTLEKWSGFGFAVPTYTPEMAQLRTGPLLNEISGHFENISRKLYMYSAHDGTIADVLNSLGLFEHHSPPYTATIFFELRERNGTYFVNVLYKNSSEPRRMVLKGCEFDCSLDRFLKIVEPLRLNREGWEFECQPKFWGFVRLTALQKYVFFACMGMLLVLLCCFVGCLIFCRRKKRPSVECVY